ncbi:hypothetical protein ACLOJK_030870 [Asimina triloba]
MKDQPPSSLLPGLSLVQWMNMQQNPSVTNTTIQPDCLRSLNGPVLQNLAGTDLSRQLGLQAQILQQNNLQFNAARPPQQQQQIDHLPKLPVTLNQLTSVNRPQQQQMDVINQQQRQQSLNQALPQSQPQAQILVQNHMQVQQQQQQLQPTLIQNHQPQTNIAQQQQQPNISMNQPQNRSPAQLPHQTVNQQLQLSEHQIQLQLLQKLQQQQQQALSQSALKQPQLSQLHEQQKQVEMPQQLLNSTLASQQLSNSTLASQQQMIAQQQVVKNTHVGVPFSQPMQQQPQQKIQQQPAVLPELPGLVPAQQPSTNLLSTHPGHSFAAGAQSVITDDVPSCSTSPSTNNSSVLPPPIVNRSQRGTPTSDEMVQTTATVLSPSTLDTLGVVPNISKELQKSDSHIKPSMRMPKTSQAPTLQPYLNVPQTDYLDTTSSGTSVCLSQGDVQVQQNFPLSSFNPSALLFRESVQDGDAQVDPTNNVLFGVNIDGQLGIPLTPDPFLAKSMGSGKDFQNQLSSADMLTNYGCSKEVQQELSSSIVSQSFGVPDMSYNPGVSLDSTINDGSFLNGGSWAPPPQFQRIRTFTKVYKRGAVGRSVDITRYSGYEELKQDLARRFGIEGQLEDRHRIGWKLVYVDHENDVLLVGDDPWEEFVNCVRCIKILSPQEVQQMSLDGDLGNNVLSNQACSSSDGGNGRFRRPSYWIMSSLSMKDREASCRMIILVATTASLPG